MKKISVKIILLPFFGTGNIRAFSGKVKQILERASNAGQKNKGIRIIAVDLPSGLNADTVDGFHAADLAAAVHSHAQPQVTGLETALAGKSDVTHNHDVLYQQKYGKVAVVAQTGGDYTDPVAAMSALATWCGTPSASNACLLKIMPGV